MGIMTTLLEQAIALIKAGDTEKAKQLLADIIRQNPRDENAWLWMTRCVGSEKEKRFCFGQVLKINPQNKHAIEGIKRLDSSVSLITEPRKKIIQQPSIPQNKQNKPKNSNSLILLLSVIGIIGFVCICAIIYSQLASPNLSSKDITAVPRTQSTSEPVYMLELLSMNDTREYDFITIEGQVKNISLVSLDAIEAVVQFYDGNGKFVKSDSALIDYNPILAGQTSPFSVITTDNPEIKRYSVIFKYLFGGTLPTKDSR